jgi:tRNA (mo5U34)-methyltransferase
VAVLDRVQPATLARIVENRVAGRVYPQVYKLRERIPRYNLHEQAQAFSREATARGLGDVSRYYWYHTVDLGEGLVTPGLHDYRSSIDEFHFPEDLTGKKVLDVGSATGFFSFEFERRGADVVSVEGPSLDDVDRFPHQALTQTVPKLAAMTAGHTLYSEEDFAAVFRAADADADADAFYHYFLDGPLRLCHKALGSRVERRYASVYDIPQTELGADEFDVVFLGDLLLHTMHPLTALAAVAPLCRDTLVISQHMPAGFGSRPAMLYVGGDRPGTDHSTWWYPNFACFQQILTKLGFRDVRVVGRNTGVSRPGGSYYERPVLHASR